ncbi:MAG: DUF1294 domain-containing protein [Clostridia bacterium]|nr:DUF1294 domain-containing protein [Clostridia bacterium]
MEYFIYGILIYLGIMSLVSVIVTLWDKRVSKIPGRRRVPEKTLLTLSALGGSVAMYITMLMIRHKTKHPKFMIGIPAIIIAQYGVFMLVRNLLR